MRQAIVIALLAFSFAALAEPFEKTEIRSCGLVANLYRPAGEGLHPAVLILGGSGGGIGWQDTTAQILAERGFAALALAYFGMDGLPAELDRIPLESIQRGLDVLRMQPFVDPERIAVIGVSKGGELALLLASMCTEIRAVVAFVPSGYVWQSIVEGDERASSWSHHGKEVSYLPYGKVAERKSIADFYRAGVEQAGARLEAATIPVEKINGPILLLTGREDNLWPSAMFGEHIEARLKAKKFTHSLEHISYPHAGHLISSIREDDVSRRGGTDEGNRRAQADAQKRMIEFLQSWARGKAKR
jgi:dienelactone hydrolase